MHSGIENMVAYISVLVGIENEMYAGSWMVDRGRGRTDWWGSSSWQRGGGRGSRAWTLMSRRALQVAGWQGTPVYTHIHTHLSLSLKVILSYKSSCFPFSLLCSPCGVHSSFFAHFSSDFFLFIIYIPFFIALLLKYIVSRYSDVTLDSIILFFRLHIFAQAVTTLVMFLFHMPERTIVEVANNVVLVW